MRRNLSFILLCKLFLLTGLTALGQTVGVTVSVGNQARGYILPPNYQITLGNAGPQSRYRVQVSTTPIFAAPIQCPAANCNTLFTNRDRVNISLNGITGVPIVPGQTYYVRAQAVTDANGFDPTQWGATFETVAYITPDIFGFDSPIATPQAPRPGLIPSNTVVTVTPLTNADAYSITYSGGTTGATTLNSATNQFALTNLQVGALYNFTAAAQFDPVPTFGRSSAPTLAVVYAPPVIVDPASGSTVTTTFDVTVDGPITNSPYVYGYQYQWSTDPNNFPADPDAQTSALSPDVFIPAQEFGFEPGQTYYLRARAWMDGNGDGTPGTWGWYGPAIAVQIALDGLAETYLNLPAINFPIAAPYFDSYTYDLNVVPVSGAVGYDWELYTTPNVEGVTPAPIPVRTNTTTTNIWPGIVTTDLVSGAVYYLRARSRAVNPNTGATIFSPWTSNANMAVTYFFNSLHPCYVTSPRGPRAQRLAVTLKTLPDLSQNISGYYFQVAYDANFTNLLRDGYPGSTSIPGIAGAVFVANDEDANGQPRYNYFTGEAYNLAYYVRARSFRKDASGNFVQLGYWSPRPDDNASFSFVVARMGFNGDFDPVDETKLAFYPNPFQKNALVNIPKEHGEVKIHVFNALGQPVEETSARGGDILNLGQEWKGGLYIIKVTDNNGLNQTLRVIKQ
jgi:hypothetical protein